MKKLAMLLALCLVLAMLPAQAFAEEVESTFAEPQAGEAAGETGALGLIAVPEDPASAAYAGDGTWLDPEDVVSQPQEWAVSALPEEDIVAPTGDAAVQAVEDDEEDEDGADDAEEAPETPHTDPDGPQLAANELTLGIGEKFKLSPKMPVGLEGAIKCKSSDKSVATVTTAGLVKAVAVGDICVTATCEDGTYAECFVHVKNAPDKVRFSAKTFELGRHEVTDALRVIVGSVEGEYAGSYNVTSSDKSVVKVHSDGTIEGMKNGKATLKVVTYNGEEATCKVSVISPPKTVTAALDKACIGVGETGRIIAELPEGTASQITYKSLNTDIATVDENTGVVTGIIPGTVRIRVRTYNNKKTYVKVKVKPAPKTLTFDDESVKIGVGMKLEFAAKVNKGAANNISYKVKKKTVATYRDGGVKGLKKGKTVLVASTYNGLTAECEVQVVAAPKKVKLPYSELTIGVNQLIHLAPDVGDSVGGFTYTTSDPKVATVSRVGTVRGKGKGTATIKVSTYNGRTCTLKLTVKKAPGSITLEPSQVDLGIGETARVTFSLPKDTAANVSYSIADSTVARLDAASGKLTGVAPGETEMTVVTHNGKKATAAIKVYPAPDWIEPDTSFLELLQGEKHELSIAFSPNSRAPLTFKSDDKTVATVSSKGVVTAKGGGQTTIHVTTNVPDVYCDVSVMVWPAPGEVALKQTEKDMEVGQTTQLDPIIPEGTVTRYTYTTSNDKVAEVSEDGKVTAVGRGTATITVKTHNNKKAKLKLTVTDPWYPEEVALANAPDYMKTNATYQLTFTLKPATAIPDLKWSTTDESIAWVDDDNVIHTSGFGYAVLSAVSRKNSAIRLEFTLAVETDSVTLTIPARTTNVADIDKNLAKIEAIHTSAINQLKAMYSGGVITKDDASKRKSMVDNAFKDYAFPWVTPSLQKYWKAENSENGAKDFKPDRVYYGLPYISGSGANRTYNAAKALSEARYKDTGNGYYVLNQNNLLNGKYCGNDCSCFVNAAIWGTSSSHSADRTSEIAESSAYKTISGFKSMRTGDLICKGYAHVVMFLYYANADKTQVMVIENGGIEAGTNTVHCIIMDVSYYQNNGYRVRRLSSLG